MKKPIVLISIMFFLLTGTNLYSQEPPPPLAQGQPWKVNTEERGKRDVNTESTDKTAQTTISKIVPNIYTSTNKATRQHTGKKDGNSEGDSKWGTTKIFNFLLTFFTGILAICNILLWVATKKSADAAKESAELVRQGFIATHHPKLRVHSIYLEKLNVPPKIVNGSYKTHRLHYSVDNIGGSAAASTKQSLAFKRLNKPLPVPFYCDPMLIEKTIACGESIIESIDVEHVLISQAEERGLDDLYFFGHIDYLDNIGTTRRTAFCRRYIQETKRFIKVDDEDYEYSY